MRKVLVAFLCLLWGGNLFADYAVPSSYYHVFTLASAAANHNSDDYADYKTMRARIDVSGHKFASLQCVWAGIGGVINATVKIQLSNDHGVTWTDKTSASISVAGASGSDYISLTNVSEKEYRAVYTAGTVNAGTIDCSFAGK